MTQAVAGHSYALLADGATVEIRPAGPDDADAVTRFHKAMSSDNLYLRFFSTSKRAGEQEARRVCRLPDVELDLRGPAEVRRAMGRLRGRFGDRLSGVLVQSMISGGTETIIGVVQEPVFGPLVVFGLGGVATEALGDHAARLAPLRQLRPPPAPAAAPPDGEAAQ